MQASAFLEDIRENPDDDAPRLVYADWLEEHGQPERAEFIRVQIELEKPDLDFRRKMMLQGKERALERRYKKEWTAHLPAWAREGAGFERGFVSMVSATETQFLRGGERLAADPITALDLWDVDTLRKTLFDSTLLGRITHLILQVNDLDSDDVRALAESPWLNNLLRLLAYAEMPGRAKQILRKRFGAALNP